MKTLTITDEAVINTVKKFPHYEPLMRSLFPEAFTTPEPKPVYDEDCPEHWVVDYKVVPSGPVKGSFKGYKNIKTGEWISDIQYQNRFEQ